VLIRALEWILELLEWKRIDFLLNNIMKLFNNIFVNFSIFSGLIQWIRMVVVMIGKSHIISVTILIVFVRLGMILV